MVSETSSDAPIVKTTATGMHRMNCPAVPGSARSGRNANSSVAVQPSTLTVICRVARTAASRGDSPWRRCRVMFSTTTTESSTRSPSASTKPTMLSWLIE